MAVEIVTVDDLIEALIGLRDEPNPVAQIRLSRELTQVMRKPVAELGHDARRRALETMTHAQLASELEVNPSKTYDRRRRS